MQGERDKVCLSLSTERKTPEATVLSMVRFKILAFRPSVV